MKAGPQLYLQCEWCHCFFEYNGGKRRRWCSDAHKQAHWRTYGTVKGSAEIVDGPLKPEAIITPKTTRRTHECVEGFIIGEINDDDICLSCGKTVI